MEVIGQLVYGLQYYFFILSGLVLLVAMIGAIVLTSQNKDKSVRVQQVFHQLSRNSRKAIFLTKKKGKKVGTSNLLNGFNSSLDVKKT
jgi:NADH-quinone oxidoreductase subunit J